MLLAGLELAHPADRGDAPFWLPLHSALLAGYLVLAFVLWRTAANRLARIATLFFALVNTAFILADGLSNEPAGGLANLTGALWSAALLGRVVAPRTTIVLLALTWLAFVATAFGVPLFISRVVALATMIWLVYRVGTAAVPTALVTFSAVLRQHVGPEAALGLLCLVPSLVSLRAERDPAAASPRATG